MKQTFKDKSGGMHTVTKNTKGKETTYTFRYLQFTTNYTFELRTKLSKGGLGKDVTIIKRTGPFSASVGPLRKNIHDNAVILSWSAPWTIDLNKDLKVSFVHVFAISSLVKVSMTSFLAFAQLSVQSCQLQTPIEMCIDS